ncbi:MAG: type IV pilin-like G/H family protein [Cyanobacteria bacterium P01_H01_bin.121]
MGAQAGLTLLELVIVIIILGLLAGVALPTLLAQASKAKESEAKQYIAATIRAQQTFYLERSEFTNSWEALEIGLPNINGRLATTDYYEYELRRFSNRVNRDGVSSLVGVRITASPEDTDTLTGYRSKVWLDIDANGITSIQSVTCEGDIGRVPNMRGRTTCP